MDDFSDDDFDSLPIKPRGAAVSPRAPVKPSPNKQTSPNVSSSLLPLMSEGMVKLPFISCSGLGYNKWYGNMNSI